METFKYSFNQFLEKMEIPQIWEEKDKDLFYSQTSNDSHFCGTKHFSESLTFLKNGLRQEKLDVSDFIKDLKIESIENQMILSYEGFQIDYSEYSSGNPECMISLQESFSENRKVEINISMVFSYYIEKSTIQNYGKMILALIEVLQSRNIDCKVTSINNFLNQSNSGKDYNFEILLKDFNEVYDSDRLTYCISHPSFLRRNLFKLLELEIDLEERRKNFSAYGRTKNDFQFEEKENQINIFSPSDNKNKEYFLNQLETILKKYK